jgi:hypothetical protein
MPPLSRTPSIECSLINLKNRDKTRTSFAAGSHFQTSASSSSSSESSFPPPDTGTMMNWRGVDARRLAWFVCHGVIAKISASSSGISWSCRNLPVNTYSNPLGTHREWQPDVGVNDAHEFHICKNSIFEAVAVTGDEWQLLVYFQLLRVLCTRPADGPVTAPKMVFLQSQNWNELFYDYFFRTNKHPSSINLVPKHWQTRPRELVYVLKSTNWKSEMQEAWE